MSPHPGVVSLLDGLVLTDSAKAALLRIARRVAGGFEGECS